EHRPTHTTNSHSNTSRSESPYVYAIHTQAESRQAFNRRATCPCPAVSGRRPPAPLARFVTEVAASLPCPPDFVGVPMLALLGCAIGASRVLRGKAGWREGPRIYAAVVAEAGTKKSPALKLAAAPFFERQRTIFQHYLRGEDLGDQAS